jgi:hypothetical protein
MQFVFGAGSLWGVRTDVSGSTPRRFGILQEVSVEFSGSLKPLTGSYRAPVAIGAGAIKTSGKAKFARINSGIYADLFFGVTPTTGRTIIAEDEPGTIPSATAYTVTVTNSATFVQDLGVWYADTGLQFQRITAGPPAAGQYSVSAGVYTFAAADEGRPVRTSYTYTALTGQTIEIDNQLLGVAPTFQSFFKGIYNGKQATLSLPNCISEKLSFGTKTEDWMIPEFDFMFYANDANVLGWLWTDD